MPSQMTGIIVSVILALSVLCLCGTSFSDTIYLNDGMSFEGKIIGFEGDKARVKTADDIFMVDRDKIKKVKIDKEEDGKIDEEYPIGPGTPQWDSNWE